MVSVTARKIRELGSERPAGASGRLYTGYLISSGNEQLLIAHMLREEGISEDRIAVVQHVDVEQRPRQHCVQHDRTDGQFADGAPDAASESAATGRAPLDDTLALVERTPGRLFPTPARGGATLLDDAYNASSPEAMEAALELLAESSGRRRLAVPICAGPLQPLR